MFRSLATVATGLASLLVTAQDHVVNVGILRSVELKQVLVMSTAGPLTVLLDGEQAGELTAKDGLRIAVKDGALSVRSLSHTFPSATRVTLFAAKHGLLRVSSLGKPAIERDYPGRIEITRTGDLLTVVDQVPIEIYVAGVVQSEAGDNKAMEYYKLQAVSCRTYAITAARRHLAEGFGLCDGTHCQVFKGICRLDSIKQAVLATKDLVVVDADIRPIHATFHSNCGGETMNAEDLWSRSERYLVSAVDTFCLHQPHATWRKTMPRTQWLGYLSRTYGLDPADSASVFAVTNFAPQCRSLYIDGARPLIPLEQVRTDMKFNSALFNIWPNGDELVFDGRGFGHGVGLCQEGAMRMARLGIPFTDILHQYFAEVHLVDLGTIDFFRDEGR